MFPLRDNQPRTSIAYVTYALIAINVAVFGYEISLGLHSQELNDFFYKFGAIPHNFELAFTTTSQFTIPGVLLTIVTSMFIHGSVLHILGNMWVLWIFGDNIEDHLGHVVYLIFYLFCGAVASMAQIYANPSSEIPTVGASGAIAGVMGAFLLRYPQAKVQLLVIFSYLASNVVWVSAWLVLAYWFGLQLFGSVWTQVLAHNGLKNAGGVAYWAHLGGFMTGMILIKLIPGRTQYSHGGWVTKEGKEVLPPQ